MNLIVDPIETPMRTINKNKGQALVETVLLLPVVTLFIFIFTFYLYTLTQKTVAQDLADQSLICATSYPHNHCKNKLREKLQNISPHVQIQRIDLYRIGRQFTVKIKYQFWDYESVYIVRTLEWLF